MDADVVVVVSDVSVCDVGVGVRSKVKTVGWMDRRGASAAL